MSQTLVSQADLGPGSIAVTRNHSHLCRKAQLLLFQTDIPSAVRNTRRFTRVLTLMLEAYHVMPSQIIRLCTLRGAVYPGNDSQQRGFPLGAILIMCLEICHVSIEATLSSKNPKACWGPRLNPARAR